MYSREFDTGTYRYSENSTYTYKTDDHPREFDFTFEEITSAYHESGSAGTSWYLTIDKDLGNGRTRKYFGIGIHVSQWLNLFKRELDRVRQGLEPTRYIVLPSAPIPRPGGLGGRQRRRALGPTHAEGGARARAGPGYGDDRQGELKIAEIRVYRWPYADLRGLWSPTH